MGILRLLRGIAAAANQLFRAANRHPENLQPRPARQTRVRVASAAIRAPRGSAQTQLPALLGCGSAPIHRRAASPAHTSSEAVAIRAACRTPIRILPVYSPALLFPTLPLFDCSSR